jgi:molybdopterin synthase sulfur carrier subunit
MKLMYFAWVRQRIGTAEEHIDLPETVSTVGDVIAWLKTRHEGYEAAFANLEVIRAAIDQEHVGLDTPIANAREIAFFPPVTGG